MINILIKLSDRQLLILLIIISIFYRLIIYFFYGNAHFSINENEIYNYEILNNLTKILNIIHTKPAGFILRDYLFIVTSNYLNLSYIITRFLFQNFLHLLCLIMLFSILVHTFSINKYFSLFILIIYSLSIVVFEYWRYSGHFDHFNIFLIVALMYFSLFVIDKSLTIFNTVGLILIIYFFNLFYTISIIPIGISIIFIGFNIFYKTNKIKQLTLLSIICISFFTSYALLCKKNFNNFNLPFSSTVQGQNSLQFSISNKFISSNDFINFIDRGNYPNWYKICAKNAHNKFNDYQSIIYGECVFKEKNGERLYKFDTDFLEFIYDNSPIYIQNHILKDLSHIKTSEFVLMNFGVSESNLFFSAEYGKISKKVSRDLQIKFPFNSFLDNFYSSIDYLIFDGSYFFQGNDYEPQLINLPYIHNIFGRFIGIFLHLGTIFALIYFFHSIIKYPSQIIRSKKLKFNDIFNVIKKNSLFIYILTNMIALIFALSLSTCCENARMFVIISPLSLVAFCYLYKNINFLGYLSNGAAEKN